MATERISVWVTAAERHDLIVLKSATVDEISLQIQQTWGLAEALQSWGVMPLVLRDVVNDITPLEQEIAELKRALKHEKEKVRLMTSLRSGAASSSSEIQPKKRPRAE